MSENRLFEKPEKQARLTVLKNELTVNVRERSRPRRSAPGQSATVPRVLRFNVVAAFEIFSHQLLISLSRPGTIERVAERLATIPYVARFIASLR